jgi:undecaprenyl-diphosphatase
MNDTARKLMSDARRLTQDRHDLWFLLTALVPVLGVWVFVELADEVIEGESRRIDEAVLQAFRTPGDLSDPIGPPELEEAMLDITALGGWPVLILVTVAVAGYLLLRRQRRATVFLFVATGGGFLVSSLLKALFARPRPDIVPHLTSVDSPSFPSGHSMLSAVVYLTLGVLLSRMVGDRAIKLYFLGVALGLTFLIGLSRIYAGVHYPSDVLAGWSAGLAWAVLCWLVAGYLQRHGRVEQGRE